jgi:signal transduction histidine kinase
MSAAARERFLVNIAGDTERLSRLVGRMMELAQADMRIGDLADRADLASILARLADSLSDTRFAIDFAVPTNLPPLAIEAAALESVLATLIDNARQAGASHIDVSSRPEGDHCVIDLVDDGPGVPAADRERIFDPFFTSHRDSGGTGLGLPIARSLVASRGGSLTLLHGEAGGRFAISLPITFSNNPARTV